METNEPVYDAILVRGTPRYRMNRKMVAADSVPAAVRARLDAELEAKEAQPVVLESPAEVQASRTTPASEAGIQPIEDSVINNPLSLKDFNDTVAQPVPAVADSKQDDYEMELIKQLESVREELFNERMKQPAKAADTLKTADIFALAKEMYSRYGVYTVFVGEPPKDGDAHPFHGGIMTRYEMGLAYQQFNRTQSQGLLNRDFSQQHQDSINATEASQRHAEEIAQRRENPNYQVPKYESFAHRTSVEGQNQSSTQTITRNNDPISEDMTAEPNLRGQTIRPQW